MFKYLVATTVTALTLLSAAPAQAFIQSVDEDAKVVNWTPTPVLEVNIMNPAGGTSDTYGILTYVWKPMQDQLNSEFKDIADKYPGYKIISASIEAVDDAILSVPAANYTVKLTVFPNGNGLYAEANESLTRRQFDAIIKAKASDPVGYIKIVGTGRADISYSEVAENLLITPDQCRNWLGRGVLRDVETNLFSYASALERAGEPRFAETKSLLLRSIQMSCYEVENSTRVETFEDLLNVRLRVKMSQPVPVKYVITRNKPVTFQVPWVLKPWNPDDQ